jgi:hypothetical protein
MHILHWSVTKQLRKTGSASKNFGFGVNIGNKHFSFHLILPVKGFFFFFFYLLFQIEGHWMTRWEFNPS